MPIGWEEVLAGRRLKRAGQRQRKGRNTMMKRRHFLAATAAAVAMPAYIRQAWAQTPEVELKLHHFLGPKAPAHTKMLEPWAKSIMDGSNGRVKIEIFPAMSLGAHRHNCSARLPMASSTSSGRSMAIRRACSRARKCLSCRPYSPTTSLRPTSPCATCSMSIWPPTSRP
jgi:hypothetical protein